MLENLFKGEESPEKTSIFREISTAFEYLAEIHRLEKELAIWRTLAIGSMLFVTGNVLLIILIVWKAAETSK